MANLVLTDDHVLLRAGLAGVVKNLGHNVIFEASNGKDFINKLGKGESPDLVLMDINMPEMDGFEATQWLKENYPEIKVLALSMYDNDATIIRMLKCGARGYILKDSEPEVLKSAIESIINTGYYYSDLVNSKLINVINHIGDKGSDINNLITITDREIEFLKYCCTEMTYKEIADKMIVSPRTVDNYRDNLFEKLDVKTRVGLVMYAIKNRICIP